MKSKGVAWICWLLCLVGCCGIHRLYAGRIGTGLLWFFTLGLLGVGQLIDIFLIGNIIEMENIKTKIDRQGYRPSIRVIINQPGATEPPQI